MLKMSQNCAFFNKNSSKSSILFALLISGPRVRVPEGAPIIDILDQECRLFLLFYAKNGVKLNIKKLKFNRK
jgi:hypothetical protein